MSATVRLRQLSYLLPCPQASAPPFLSWRPARTPLFLSRPLPSRTRFFSPRFPPQNPPPPPQSLDTDSLFASSPELEQLAIKSVSAPILVRIVSYNLLSSSLADPTHFPACLPHNLASKTRLQRVLAKLEGPVASRSIICLQEVSLAWSGHLHAFFANRGFHLMLAAHGSYFNGYMGEGLAFPLDLYEAVDLNIERLTDCMQWPMKKKGGGLARVAEDVKERVCKAWNALFGPQRPKRNKYREPWEYARGRYNRFIFARLRSKTNGARLCVATYHMPCIYWSPSVMLIHSALVVRTFQKLCRDDLGVIAGDFNIKPSDTCYQMILNGEIDPAHDDYPNVTPDGSSADKWFPVPLKPMKKNQPLFIETLDYLFCAPELDIVDVIRLPNRDAVQGPLPDENEPSDHIMIGATIRLPAPVRKQRMSVSSSSVRK